MSGVEFIGPFSEVYHKVSVDGFLVPHIKAMKLADGGWSILLDDRLAYDFPAWEAEGPQLMRLVANAMAVAAGYGAFGENSVEINPFKCRITGISLAE